MRPRGGHILDGMANTLRNKHFVARLCDDRFSADGEFEAPIHNSHELVRRMDEIIPLSAWWVGEQVTGVAPPAPVLSHLVTVEGRRELMKGEIGHEAKL